jgi:putative nucleotidyltransferase with HDIG domain
MTVVPLRNYRISEETRRRCHIFKLDDKSRHRFSVISLELFHFFYESNRLPCSIFFRCQDTMIEYMQANEFSAELLDNLWQAMQNRYEDIEVCIRKSDTQKLEKFFDHVRSQKIATLREKSPELDPKVMEAYAHLSSASQMIVKGGINADVAKKVEASAINMVNSTLDNISIINTISRMITCDPTLYDHSASVAILAGVIAKNNCPRKLDNKEIRLVVQCGLYHDVGKTCVPNHILNKPGRFTPAEFEIMKTHTTKGAKELLACIGAGAPLDDLTVLVALEHHEKFDGKGYPNGKRGRLEDDPDSGIHLYSRITTIADVYSALLMKRVYKPSYEPQDAIRIMTTSAELDYDPEIFSEFVLSVVKSLNKSEETKDPKTGRILFFDEKGQLQEKEPGFVQFPLSS